jgi:hypothetical protein
MKDTPSSMHIFNCHSSLPGLSALHPCFIHGSCPCIVAALSLALVSILSAGCGSGDTLARYRVTGKVTYRGQPVEQGEITFEDPAAGQVNSSPLGSGGSYALELPAGEFRVSVAPPLIETKGTGDSPPDKVPDPAVKNIPKKYWRQESSGLTAQVAKDKRTFEFELQP